MYRIICFIALFYFVNGKHESYDGHAVYEIKVTTVDQTSLVNEIGNKFYADVWSHALPGRVGEVLIAGDKREAFENELNDAGIEFGIIVENVKELLDLEDRLLSEATRNRQNRTVGLPFDRIYTYEQVDRYLEELAAAYPNVVTLVNAGLSFERRTIKYLKISTTNFQDQTKPIVFMESLLHAREWITLPASLYAIERLVLDILVSEQDLIRDIDWIILPVANPDGYHFSQNESRFWRKNRATGYAVGNLCMGVDLNRNFDVNWSEHSSNLVCLDTFHGRYAFSEPETAIIRDIILENADRLELFLDIHSFGSMILYGYGTGSLPANGLTIHVGGIQMATAIDDVKMSWNPDYVVGNVAAVLYEASGSAMDYAKVAGAPLAYTYELPGHRLGIGAAGFLVDPAFIEQAGFETWQGIKAGARFARNNYRSRKGYSVSMK